MKAIGVRSLLVLSIVLTLVSALITYLNGLEKKETVGLVIHHYRVIQASTRLLSLMKDMEIGHRGYLITGDTTFLQPYRQALQDINKDMDTLSLLVKEYPRQLDIVLQHLVPLVEMKERNLQESFRILKEYGRDSATHFSAMRISKAGLDSIRYWAADFIQFEQASLNERNDALEQKYFLEDVVRFSSFALIGMTSLAALITIANKERDNRKLLIELQQFNQQLELKVRERTRQLEEANKNLVRLNEEKNNFLGITTHDLKAPLAGISGLLELMKLEPSTLSAKHMEYIQLMEETCDNMQRLISDLLDLSRIEQGTTNLNYRDVSLPRIFNQLEERFRQWAGRKDLRLSFSNQVVSESIRTDPDMLLRILDNLISNAIKFSPRGKSIMVSVHEEDQYFRFDVQDEGPGIRSDEKNKLFRKFQKLSVRPSDGESSSGLGLSIVKDLLDILRGTIEVNSEVGAGALFSVRLPRV